MNTIFLIFFVALSRSPDEETIKNYIHHQRQKCTRMHEDAQENTKSMAENMKLNHAKKQQKGKVII